MGIVLPAVRPWGELLNLSVPSPHLEWRDNGAYLMGLLEGLDGLTHVRHLKQCLAHSQNNLLNSLTLSAVF
jgi:hypothetical protein